MKSEIKVRISKKFTLYIPKAIAEAVGLKEGDYVKIRMENSKIVLRARTGSVRHSFKRAKVRQDYF